MRWLDRTPKGFCITAPAWRAAPTRGGRGHAPGDLNSLALGKRQGYSHGQGPCPLPSFYYPTAARRWLFATLPRTRNLRSSAFSFSTMPPYSSSLYGSIADPEKPWSRMSEAFCATFSRTKSQYG